MQRIKVKKIPAELYTDKQGRVFVRTKPACQLAGADVGQLRKWTVRCPLLPDGKLEAVELVSRSRRGRKWRVPFFLKEDCLAIAEARKAAAVPDPDWLTDDEVRLEFGYSNRTLENWRLDGMPALAGEKLDSKMGWRQAGNRWGGLRFEERRLYKREQLVRVRGALSEPAPDGVVSIKQAAFKRGVSEQTIRRAAREGRLNGEFHLPIRQGYGKKLAKHVRLAGQIEALKLPRKLPTLDFPREVTLREGVCYPVSRAAAETGLSASLLHGIWMRIWPAWLREKWGDTSSLKTGLRWMPPRKSTRWKTGIRMLRVCDVGKLAELLGRVGQGKAVTVSSNKPTDPKIAARISLNAADQVTVDGEQFLLTADQADFMRYLINAAGEWVPGTRMEIARPDRTRGRLPPSVKLTVEPSTRGYRLKPEYV